MEMYRPDPYFLKKQKKKSLWKGVWQSESEGFILRYGDCVRLTVFLPLELRHQDGYIENHMAIQGLEMVRLPTKSPMALKIGKVM